MALCALLIAANQQMLALCDPLFHHFDVYQKVKISFSPASIFCTLANPFLIDTDKKPE